MQGNDFYDEIPLMINRACRLTGKTKAELGRELGYTTPESMSRLCNGSMIDGMPLGKLMILLELSECSYEWRRN